jgi:hypothetical protein
MTATDAPRISSDLTDTDKDEPLDKRSMITTGSTFYADSTCPTCRVTLMRNTRFDGYRTMSHTHSADELMYVLDGDMRIGSQVAGPDTVITIAGNHRYAFRSVRGFDFLNYRADASYYTGDPRTPRVLETVEALVMSGAQRVHAVD